MNIYALPLLVSFILGLTLSVFLFVKNRKSIVNILFAFEWLSVSMWFLGYFIAYSTHKESTAIFWVKFTHTGVIFIPIFMHHFVMAFLKIPRKSRIIRLNYIIGILLSLVLWKTNYIVKGVYRYFWGYYAKTGFLQNLFLIYLFVLFLDSFINLSKKRMEKRGTSPVEYTRISYIFWFYVIAVIGVTDFLPNYGIEYYPIGFIFATVGWGIITYAILRHRLMEIEVVIKKTAIFAGLFIFISMVFVGLTLLTQQFFVDTMGPNSRWLMFILCITIITIGIKPLDKLLVRLTDRFLFQEKYKYQEVLKEASEGMTLVTDMTKLLNYIVRVVSKAIRLKNASIFQYDHGIGRFVLKTSRGIDKNGYAMENNSALVAWIMEHKQPLLIDEIEDWLRSDRFLRKQETLKERLLDVKKELADLKGTICVPSFAKANLIGFLVLGEKLSGDLYTQEDIRLLSTLASEAAIAVENAQNFMELEKLRIQERESYLQTVMALAQTVDEKDFYTHGHLEEVTYYGMQIAKELEESEEFSARINKEDLEISLRLHDIGKIGIPDRILHKNGKLTDTEWVIMKQHCNIGARIVAPIQKLKRVVDIIRYHQERYDGSGYPLGLKADEIPLESRIIAVVDAYHAMISDRPYRKALSEEKSISELKNNIGIQFDPVIVGLFIKAWESGKIKKPEDIKKPKSLLERIEEEERELKEKKEKESAMNGNIKKNSNGRNKIRKSRKVNKPAK